MTRVLFERVVVRLHAVLIFAAGLATIVLAHLNLLHVSEPWKDTISLACIILIALTNPPVSKYVEPRVEQDVRP